MPGRVIVRNIRTCRVCQGFSQVLWKIGAGTGIPKPSLRKAVPYHEDVGIGPNLLGYEDPFLMS